MYSPCDYGSSGCVSFGDSDNTDVTNPSALATSTTFITWSSKKLKTNIKYTDVTKTPMKYVDRFRKVKFCSYL